MEYKLNEIFYSIQGEGANAGMAAIFIRFSGCDMTCDFCDTDHRHRTSFDEEMILMVLRTYPCREVILTGGEPLAQDLSALLLVLRKNGYWVGIETNGNLMKAGSCADWLRGVARPNWITVSPKVNGFDYVFRPDEIKIIYPTRLNLEEIESLSIASQVIQPCDGPNLQENTEQAIAFVKEHPAWRLSVQVQKYIGVR